jgi:hypothetical protein
MNAQLTLFGEVEACDPRVIEREIRQLYQDLENRWCDAKFARRPIDRETSLRAACSVLDRIDHRVLLLAGAVRGQQERQAAAYRVKLASLPVENLAFDF